MTDRLTLEPILIWDKTEWFSHGDHGIGERLLRIERVECDERENKLTEVSLSDILLENPYAALSNVTPPINSVIRRIDRAWPQLIQFGFGFARAFKNLTVWPVSLERQGIRKIACIGARVKFTPGRKYYLRLEYLPDPERAGQGRIGHKWIPTSNPRFNKGEHLAFYLPPKPEPSFE